jgi:hypothetical protein
MRRLATKAALIVLLSGAGFAGNGNAHAQQISPTSVPNNAPLYFGMNVEQVSQVLGTTLNYVSGRPGEELYLATRNVKGNALSDRTDGLYLQFRRGKLAGWKGEWRVNRPCCG